MVKLFLTFHSLFGSSAVLLYTFSILRTKLKEQALPEPCQPRGRGQSEREDSYGPVMALNASTQTAMLYFRSLLARPSYGPECDVSEMRSVNFPAGMTQEWGSGRGWG